MQAAAAIAKSTRREELRDTAKAKASKKKDGQPPADTAIAFLASACKPLAEASPRENAIMETNAHLFMAASPSLRLRIKAIAGGGRGRSPRSPKSPRFHRSADTRTLK